MGGRGESYSLPIDLKEFDLRVIAFTKKNETGMVLPENLPDLV